MSAAEPKPKRSRRAQQTTSKRTGKTKQGAQGDGGGRPKKPIDYALVARLAKIHCTQDEIANIIGVSVDTLHRDERFCGCYKKGMDNGRMSVRRQQFKLLDKGNCTMAIWLGKQLLGQRDRTEVTGDQGGPVKVSTEYDLSKLTVDQLLALKAAMAAAKKSPDAAPETTK